MDKNKTIFKKNIKELALEIEGKNFIIIFNIDEADENDYEKVFQLEEEKIYLGVCSTDWREFVLKKQQMKNNHPNTMHNGQE